LHGVLHSISISEDIGLISSDIFVDQPRRLVVMIALHWNGEFTHRLIEGLHYLGSNAPPSIKPFTFAVALNWRLAATHHAGSRGIE
jgi:hypothetical protein